MEGLKVVYRSPKKSDLKQLLDYINRIVGEDTFIVTGKQTMKSQKKWLDERLSEIKRKKGVMTLAEMDGKIVGNCGITRGQFNRTTHRGVFGISVSKDYRGKGIGMQIAKRTLAAAKKKLGLKLVTLTYFEGNMVARDLYERLGFKECGKIPKAIQYKGKYVDEIHMYKKL